MTRRRGVTLIELLVVVAILALTAGMAVAAFSDGISDDGNTVSEQRRIVAEIAHARREALRSGSAVVFRIHGAPAGFVNAHPLATVLAGTALPDGSVLLDSPLAVASGWDRLSGKSRTASFSREEEGAAH